MRRYILFLIFLVGQTSIAGADVGPATWYLPRKLSDANTSIRFEVDSTWHLVKGKTAGISGMAELGEDQKPSSVRVDLRIPVAKFDTDNGSRDERMREVMQADQYNSVHFRGTGIEPACMPAAVLRDGECKTVMHGELTLLSTSRNIDIPIRIRAGDRKNFKISGEVSIRWDEFGVEDPSIWIATLDKVVTIFFEVELSSSES